MRAVQPGALAGLVGQVLLLAVLGGTVGLTITGWAIGPICGVTMSAALARGLSRHGYNRLRAADWVTLAWASLVVGVARHQVKGACARCLEYLLDALISVVQHCGKQTLVLVVVGDEQPLAIVSGQHAGHDAPISISAGDASVLKRIGGWDWQSGLLPSPHAPVRPISALRDRLLTAYGPQPITGSSP